MPLTAQPSREHLVMTIASGVRYLVQADASVSGMEKESSVTITPPWRCSCWISIQRLRALTNLAIRSHRPESALTDIEILVEQAQVLMDEFDKSSRTEFGQETTPHLERCKAIELRAAEVLDRHRFAARRALVGSAGEVSRAVLITASDESSFVSLASTWGKAARARSPVIGTCSTSRSSAG